MEARPFSMQAVTQGGRINHVHDDIQRDRSSRSIGDSITMADGSVYLEQNGDGDGANDLKTGAYPGDRGDEKPPG